MAEQNALIRTTVRAEHAEVALIARYPGPRAKKAAKRHGYKALLIEGAAVSLRFDVFGAVCRRDEFGEHFNFPQLWTPYPGIAMSTLFADSPQTLTLSLNVLDRFIRNNLGSKARNHPAPLATDLTAAFAEDILAPMAGLGWHLPAETLRNWIETNATRLKRRP
jgi:hypothetical protein